ncbi:MAG TPA: glycosyltransferase family 1 protein, partial [Caldimonas sp.]|nr:glycosyltransferase family 1 protein [Caldimonas sp.]
PDSLPVALDARRFATRVVPGLSGTWWEQVQAPRAAAGDHLDVWFAPAYTCPLSLPIPIVLSVHDLSFFARPEWFTAREGLRRRWVTRESVARASTIITISQFSKRELMERLDVAAERIAVIPPGIAFSRQPSAISHRAPRVLFVGSLFTRRHVTDLIRAFAPIARAHAGAALDIVGDNRTYPFENIRATIGAEQLDERVSWHQYVSDTQLSDLYANARAFAFLSEYEGLGLTPLEALAAGLPPVLLETPVAHESCADAAVYVPLGDLPATTRALEQALFDDELRRTILTAAPGVLARYDWPRAADTTLQAIERCSR